jgi:D-3-phosphoglycerate dehydrogenase
MPAFTVLVTAPQWADEARQAVAEAGGHVECMDGPVTADTLVQRLAAEPVHAIVLRGSPPLTARVLGAAQGLRIVAKNGAGIDSVDLDAAQRLGITVAVAAGGNADAVAEHALALMLALVRELPGRDRRVRAGAWGALGPPGRDFRGSVLGLVGYGAIGRATARLATALGARVIVHRLSGGAGDVDGHTAEPELPALLAQADIVSLHCRLDASTRGLIGARELALMKPGALLINTARGAVVDEPALVAALQRGHLGGAGLDTFATEPLPAGHALTSLDNVILTPHVAGTTRDSARRVALMTAHNVIDHLAGRPLPAANRVVG